MKTLAEQQSQIATAVASILEAIGEDATRDGLQETPDRVARAWLEITNGYSQDPATILGKVFTETYDEMVVLKDIAFYSTCEHHLLPFSGVAHVGYLPGEKVVGISKLARLVHCFARRLQIQERLTRQVAEAIESCLHATGVAVVVEARHLCMVCRGVRQPDSIMVTSSMLGLMRESPPARAEFLKLIGRGD